MKLDLRLDEVLPQSVGAVWRALTDSRLLARWLMQNDFEPRVGHRFTLRDPPTNEWRGWIECEVLELEPPRRMVWSWNGGSPGESTSRLVFELRAEGTGTRLVLQHLGDDSSEAQRASLRSGWARKLSHLGGALGADYGRRVAFRAPRPKVFDAIATMHGLSKWFTSEVTGSASSGGELRLAFSDMAEHVTIRVDESERPSVVRWKCLAHVPALDWAGTRVHFELLERAAEGSELHFRHEGLRPDLECYDRCARAWDRLLSSLVAYVETDGDAPLASRSERSVP